MLYPETKPQPLFVKSWKFDTDAISNIGQCHLRKCYYIKKDLPLLSLFLQGGHWDPTNPDGIFNPSGLLFLSSAFLTVGHVKNRRKYWQHPDPNVPAGSSWSCFHSSQLMLERRLAFLKDDPLTLRWCFDELLFTRALSFSVERKSF